MISKDKMPVVIGVAFVWFTTQFGGGFASGNQLRQYFLNYGIWAFLSCVLAQLIGAFYQWYGLKYAKKHNLYNYKSFNDHFYGKFAPIFSNLYELVYIVLIFVAPSAAFATGTSTMVKAFGMNYWVSTLIIGLFIFIVAVYGTDIVRKVAATLSVLIVLGLFIVYIPNIVVQWSDITANISNSIANPPSFKAAMWQCFVYASFQLGSIGLLFQHAKPFHSPDEAKRSMIYGFFVNSAMVLLAVLGLFAITNDENFATESIPLLILVNKGVAPALLRPIISILIILGSVSTAVNMIAGMTNRICSSLDKDFDPSAKPGRNVIIVTLICTLVAFGIAQFGLNAIVGKGYRYLGFLSIPVIMIPYVIHMIATKFDTK